jgi:predicted Rossmann fold nucleotide-binding protein DprA/Smf involved in DNA uptake
LEALEQLARNEILYRTAIDDRDSYQSIPFDPDHPPRERATTRHPLYAELPDEPFTIQGLADQLGRSYGSAYNQLRHLVWSGDIERSPTRSSSNRQYQYQKVQPDHEEAA